MFKVIYVFLFVIIASSQLCKAQSGMDFREFAQKLELYYDKALVEDVHKQMPQGTDYRVWGWDVGDFSGDGNYDVAFTIRLADDKRRQVVVYLFVDVDGYLNNVSSTQYNFVDTPLEVGMVIKNNACYITRKRKLYDWVVRGYRFAQGSVVLVDEFVTGRIENFTREYYRNFQTLHHELKFLQQATNDITFDNNFLAIPCYTRGEQTYKGYTSQADVSSVDYVNKGSFYWSGEDDCSFSVRSAFDPDFLYMTVAVRDDEIVTAHCDTCPADYIDIWIDSSMPDEANERVFKKKGKRLQFRSSADSNIYKITMKLGDFLEKKPVVIVSSSEGNEAERQQKSALKLITKKVALRERGYIAKIRIPFTLFGFAAAPVDEKQISELGCTVVVHDIDNEYRPEEETSLGTSQVEEMNPSTFGTLLLIPQDKFFGESTNIFADGLIKYLNEMGF